MLKNILQKIPKQAGIYQYFDKNGKIIYIGKSVNLKSRVNSYFNGKSKLNFAKQKMVEQIKDIKTIITNNETESLILETTLIKEHLPKYNILMKDGKNHIYIKITTEEFPKIIKTRSSPQPSPEGEGVKRNTLPPEGGELEGGVNKEQYFGPYVSSNDVDNIFKVIKKVFGYGVANNNFFKNSNSYTLDKYLFSSPQPSPKGEGEKELYLQKLEEIKKFLKGDYKQVISQLREKMMELAMNHEFERADVIKKQIESIETLNEKQIVREGIIGDFDVINYLEKFDKTFIGIIKIRNSKIIDFSPYEIENNLGENIDVILENFVKTSPLTTFLIQEGENSKNIPKIIISKKIELKEKLFKKVDIIVPKKGTKLDLLKMCYKNLYEFAYKKHINNLSTKGFTKQTMKNLLHILGYSRINKDIIFECNDISHLSGTHTVASRSVIENGKTANSKYKKFKIKNLEEGKIDDFNSMREIMERRLLEIGKTGFIPDLIIIDGGKGQLSSVVEVVESSPLASLLIGEGDKILQLVGIAKKEEILYKISPPSPPLEGGIKKSQCNFEEIKLEKDSLELRLIQKIRDEAHRFAITFNRDSRIKSSKKNILESLPGIGPKTRKKILKEYGSVENLANTDKEKIKNFLGKKVFEVLEVHGLV